MAQLRLTKVFLLFSDLLAFLFAYGIGCLLLIQYGKYEDLNRFSVWWEETGLIHSGVHAVFVLICLSRFYIRGVYSKRLLFWDELRLLLVTILSIALLNGMVVLVAKWPFSRVLWFGSWAFAMLFVPLFRSATRRFLRRIGIWHRPTLIIGAGQNALDTIAALEAESKLGFQVAEIITLSKKSVSEIHHVPVREMTKENLLQYLRDLFDAKKIYEVFIALDENEMSDAGTLVEEIGLYVPTVFFVPSLAGLPLFGMDSYHFFSHELLILRSKNNLSFRPQFYLKRAFDFTLSFLLLILLSPLLLWISFRTRLSGPGIFFAHQRIGQKGKPFWCYKFRTMVPNAETKLKELLERDPKARREWEDKMKIENDPRITSVGHFLRRTSLDELPQLWNVLKGDMSLVGPRPIVHKEKERYGHRIEFYQRVRPGITGLWQVSGRSDTDYGTRVRLDTWYSKNWTLWYDLAILFKTVKIVVNRKGAY